MRLNGCLMQALTLLLITGMTLFSFFTIVETEVRPAVPMVVTEVEAVVVSPTLIPRPTSTPLPTNTTSPTPIDTPTTIPSSTATNTATPIPTNTATSTPSDTPTMTATFTATFTATATFTPTPAVLCTVRINRLALVNVREEPDVSSEIVVQLPNDIELDVYDQTIGADTLLWHFVEFEFEGEAYEGWIRSDLVAEVTPCPEQ